VRHHICRPEKRRRGDRADAIFPAGKNRKCFCLLRALLGQNILAGTAGSSLSVGTLGIVAVDLFRGAGCRPFGDRHFVRPQISFCVTGWFWFAGTLIPVIGLVQVGVQSMADRYTYLPLIGVFIMIAWGAHAIGTSRRGSKSWLIFLAVII